MAGKQNRADIANRLKRIEGQIRGIAGMVEAERYCVDILTQTTAVRSALRAVDRLIMEDHAKTCIESAIQSGDPDEQRAKFNELVAILQDRKG